MLGIFSSDARLSIDCLLHYRLTTPTSAVMRSQYKLTNVRMFCDPWRLLALTAFAVSSVSWDVFCLFSILIYRLCGHLQ